MRQVCRQSRADAASRGAKVYKTGLPCINGHTGNRYTTSSGCVQCITSAVLEKQKTHREELQAHRRLRYKNDAVYRGKEKARLNLIDGKRSLRNVKWADTGRIAQIFANCPEGFHVDHIIPLLGKNVSGLHVEENLQYIPAGENSAKGNKYILDDEIKKAVTDGVGAEFTKRISKGS